jgi:hypothetical protein
MFQVAAVPEDVGTAGALRAIAHRLTAKDIMVSICKTYSYWVLECFFLQLLASYVSAGCEW